MPPPPPDVSIVVPTYNERDALPALVDALFRATGEFGIDLELVVVDDGSPDGTGAVADELAQSRRMKVIHRSGKLGLGSAVVEGFAAASAEILGVMDADLSHPPTSVPRMLAVAKARRADMVIASRYVPGGGIRHWPLRRQAMSRVACWLARPLSPVRDATSGFFLVQRDLGRRITLKARGFKVGLEVLVRACPSRVVEVPYVFDDRQIGQSKMNLQEVVRYLAQLAALYRLSWTQGRSGWRYEYVSAADVERMVHVRR